MASGVFMSVCVWWFRLLDWDTTIGSMCVLTVWCYKECKQHLPFNRQKICSPSGQHWLIKWEVWCITRVTFYADDRCLSYRYIWWQGFGLVWYCPFALTFTFTLTTDPNTQVNCCKSSPLMALFVKHCIYTFPIELIWSACCYSDQVVPSVRICKSGLLTLGDKEAWCCDGRTFGDNPFCVIVRDCARYQVIPNRMSVIDMSQRSNWDLWRLLFEVTHTHVLCPCWSGKIHARTLHVCALADFFNWLSMVLLVLVLHWFNYTGFDTQTAQTIKVTCNRQSDPSLISLEPGKGSLSISLDDKSLQLTVNWRLNSC